MNNPFQDKIPAVDDCGDSSEAASIDSPSVKRRNRRKGQKGVLGQPGGEHNGYIIDQLNGGKPVRRSEHK
jgi:hypothetical protein